MIYRSISIFIFLALLLFQFSACKGDGVKHYLTSQIFELKAASIDSTRQTFIHFQKEGDALVYDFLDFSKIELQTAIWDVKDDSLRIEWDNGSQPMTFSRKRPQARHFWTTNEGDSIISLDLKSLESTIFIPADKYGINEAALPFLFWESTKGDQLLMRLFSSCDYLSTTIDILSDQPLNIQLPPRRFESNCPYLERSTTIKDQIIGSDQIKYEFPELFFMKKGETSGHWRALGGLLLDL